MLWRYCGLTLDIETVWFFEGTELKTRDVVSGEVASVGAIFT
jgi:hypothetical protein